METDDVKQKILDLYYGEHMRPVDIAPIVKKSPQYVSKVVKKDSRYENEKEYRHIQSSEKKKAYNRKYYKTYTRNKKEKEERELYNALIVRINKDNQILSTKTEISDIDFAKWNASAYHTNSKGNLMIDKKLNVGFDVPKLVNTNIKLPTQKYKEKYYFSV